jgi:hypothetical protein
MRNPRFLIGLFLRGLRWNPCSDIADPVLGDSSIQCLKSLSNGDELSSGSQAFPSLNGNVKDLKYVELVLDLFPKQSRYHVAGKYDLINYSEQPLDQLLLTAGLHWEKRWF